MRLIGSRDSVSAVEDAIKEYGNYSRWGINYPLFNFVNLDDISAFTERYEIYPQEIKASMYSMERGYVVRVWHDLREDAVNWRIYLSRETLYALVDIIDQWSELVGELETEYGTVLKTVMECA